MTSGPHLEVTFRGQVKPAENDVDLWLIRPLFRSANCPECARPAFIIFMPAPYCAQIFRRLFDVFVARVTALVVSLPLDAIRQCVCVDASTLKALKCFLYKPWRPKGFWNHHNLLVRSFRFIWIPMLWVWGHYIFFLIFQCGGRL